MQENLRRMENAVTEWMIKNEIIGDAKFYSADEWKKIDSSWPEETCLVLVFDGSHLYTLLNYGGDLEEFDDLIESFGFYYALVDAWNMRFCPLEEYDFTPSTGSYSNKLLDPRWQRKASLVKERAGNKCQDCEKTGRLEAHHCYYLSMREGYEPWEYPLSAFRALCPDCHASREKAEIRMRAFMADMTQTQMDTLRNGLNKASYWFKRDALLEFISKLGRSYNNEELLSALNILLTGRCDSDK